MLLIFFLPVALQIYRKYSWLIVMGETEGEIDFHKVRIYDRDRTICDVLRNMNKIDKSDGRRNNWKNIVWRSAIVSEIFFGQSVVIMIWNLNRTQKNMFIQNKR